jgi:hypothetical protein
LAGEAVRGLIRLVVGVGIAVFHSRTTVMPNPSTLQPFNPSTFIHTLSHSNQSIRLPRSGLVQSGPRVMTTPTSRPVSMTFRNSNLHPVIDARPRL